MFKKIIKIFVLSFGFIINMYAQQDSQFTQYMYNTISINPAYAGTKDITKINLLHRSQWVGVDGAPKSNTLSLDTPVGDRWGLGASLYNDQIGPVTETVFGLDMAYQIRLTRDVWLSFGVKLGLDNINVDFTKLNIENPLDTAFQDNLTRFNFVFGAGSYMYSDSWYLGVSSPNLIPIEHYRDVMISDAGVTKHMYVIGGYVFDVCPNVKFKPAGLMKFTVGAPMALDVSANFLFHERLTLGMSYRVDAAVSFIAGIQVSKNLMLGYAYDYDTTKFSNYNSGSHEFFLRYEFYSKIKNHQNPRFF